MQRALSWIVGAGMLVAVVAIAVHLSEATALALLIETAHPAWLACALAVQAATYLAQAEVFRAPVQATGLTLPRRWLYRLSVAKLFLDQTLPSAASAARRTPGFWLPRSCSSPSRSPCPPPSSRWRERAGRCLLGSVACPPSQASSTFSQGPTPT